MPGTFHIIFKGFSLNLSSSVWSHNFEKSSPYHQLTLTSLLWITLSTIIIQTQLEPLSECIKTLSSLPSISALSSSEASTAGHLHSSSTWKVVASQDHKILNRSFRSNRIILFNIAEASFDEDY